MKSNKCCILAALLLWLVTGSLYADVTITTVDELKALRDAVNSGTSYVGENIYLKAAYEQLEIISQDEQKRLEYTARQKALYDYNTIVEENFERGLEQGIGKGIKQKEAELIEKWRAKGMTDEQIRELLE